MVMLLESLFINDKDVRPGKLVLRFILSASILFLFFIILSFIFLKRTSDKNLYHYYQQEYLNICNALDNINSSYRDHMVTLTELPGFYNQFSEYLEYYESYKNTGIFPSDINRPLNEPPEKPFAGDSEIPGALPPGVNNMPVQFISNDGILIAGTIPEKLYREFSSFEKLKETVIDQKGFGLFFVLENMRLSETVSFMEPVIYFFIEIRDDAGENCGYIATEARLGMITGNLTESGMVSGPDRSVNANDDIYSLFKNVHRYLIDKEGKPVTELSSGSEYSEKLRAAGWSGNYQTIPVINPLKYTKIEGFPEQSNIMIINTLISEKPDGLTGFGKTYRNYLNSRVIGAGFWIEELDFGYIMEINDTRAFAPYINSLVLIFFILFINFSVFLYLILWINNLRIRALDANPLTKLPGNRVINKKIQEVLNENAGTAIVYGDLDNFKAYNDTYGFSKGDEVIHFTAGILKKVVTHYPSKNTFCGHIGGDDFIFIVPSEAVHNAADEICRLFDNGIRNFYSKIHLDDGYIEEKNREGQIMKFPIMAFSMAGVITGKVHMSHFLEVSGRCGELKKYAKKTKGSNLVLDRRTS